VKLTFDQEDFIVICIL